MYKRQVVVAFSGGLDTSFTVMYLAKEKGYEVYAACANTGGFLSLIHIFQLLEILGGRITGVFFEYFAEPGITDSQFHGQFFLSLIHILTWNSDFLNR